MLVRPSAVAALVAAVAVGPRPVASAGCSPAYNSGTSYEGGDVVSASVQEHCSPAGVGTCPATGMVSVTYNFACMTGMQSQFCNQIAFAPGGLFSDSAWTQEPTPCTGTAPTPVATPTTSPTASPIPAPWSGAGCPPAYVAGADYAAAQLVSVDFPGFTTVYQCADAPTNLFCGSGGYEPGNGLYTDSAWTALGTCTGTIAPTGSPVYVSLADVGGCPDAFDALADYESGDTVTLNGLVYQCKAGPQGLYCGQVAFEPGTTNGATAWDLLGFCDGTIAPTSSPSFDALSSVGGCPGAFDASAAYEPGDTVEVDGLVYECKPEPSGRHCSQAGFEPGTTVDGGGQTAEFWRKGWAIIGHCSGTIAPTSSPSFDVLTDFGGCPDSWVSGAFVYEEGDKVSDGKLVYQCKAWPESLHCGQAGYEPNTNPATPDAWKDAWTVVGHCSGTGVPTQSPSFDTLSDVGACPDTWVRGSNVSYEEGDMVSVTVSASPLRQVAYRCKKWPLSGFCGQFSPDEFGGSQGWTLAGSCDGSIGPTASPSFDELTATAGCPEAWDPSRKDYEAGDTVAYAVSASPARILVYACLDWPNTGYCNEGVGFEPTTRFAYLAWTLVGACDGSLAPTSSPVQYQGTCEYLKCVTTQMSGAPNCGLTPVNLWSDSVTYVEGDQVRVGVKRFQCREFPMSLWCPMAAYMPTLEDNSVWSQAWTQISDCPP